MKKLQIFTAALALSFLIFTLYNKRRRFVENAYDEDEHEGHSHHVTDVFAKAKKVAMSDQPESS